jgi:hypothetical protein
MRQVCVLAIRPIIIGCQGLQELYIPCYSRVLVLLLVVGHILSNLVSWYEMHNRHSELHHKQSCSTNDGRLAADFGLQQYCCLHCCFMTCTCMLLGL